VSRRKSVVLKALEGNPGKRPLPEKEPIPPAELPDPPEILDTYAREEWMRVGPGLAALGILSGIDRGLLTAYCMAWSRWKHAEEELQRLRDEAVAKGKNGELAALVNSTKAGNIIQNPLVGISNAAAAAYVKYGDLLGMGVNARARIGIDLNKKPRGKFDGLVGMPGGKK
jgi:P27 family predicted phage terminase small subunit